MKIGDIIFYISDLSMHMKKQSQDLRASANGLSVTLMSIFKAVAPAVAGVM